MADKLLEIKNLFVEYETSEATVYAINGISINIGKGETLGLVGETGAGKTTTALSILRLLPKETGHLKQGEIFFNGQNLLDLPEDEMRKVRGDKISMIFQDPMTTLNPVLTVEEQIGEAIELHRKELDKKEIAQKVSDMLELVGIPAQRKTEFPHQFSGGMKQRVVIAMALACQPELLIADEPTTALDVTVQAQVLDMMDDLKQKLNTSMILITHDLGIVAQMCDYVAIMYAGEIIESGTIEDIYDKDLDHHPYTVGLFGSIPNLTQQSDRLQPVDGLMPDPMSLPPGCKFHTRCNFCMDKCREEVPADRINGTHAIKCHLFNQQ